MDVGRQPRDTVDAGRSSDFQRPLQDLKPKKQRRLELGLVEDYLAQLRMGAGWSKAKRGERQARTDRESLDD